MSWLCDCVTEKSLVQIARYEWLTMQVTAYKSIVVSIKNATSHPSR